MICHRQHHVEKAPSLGGRTRDERDVVRREHHRWQRAERVAQPLGHGAVDARALSVPGALEADGDLVTRSAGVDLRRDVERLRSKADEIRVARTARRAQELQVVNRLEQIRLALAVLADDDPTRGRRSEVHMLEVPKVANDEAR